MAKATMKIVGICGSPRKGNTEWMLSTLCGELIRLGAEVEMLLLRKMDVKMCHGCLVGGGRYRISLARLHGNAFRPA
jgi:multimeric flavodoxin WrbA